MPPGGYVGLLEAFSRAVKLAGGAEWLAARLDKTSGKIYEALADAPGRAVHLRWLLPVLEEPAAAYEVLAWLCEAAGYAPPVRKREVTRAELDAAISAELDADGGLVREELCRRAAKRIGVKVEDLP